MSFHIMSPKIKSMCRDFDPHVYVPMKTKFIFLSLQSANRFPPGEPLVSLLVCHDVWV